MPEVCVFFCFDLVPLLLTSDRSLAQVNLLHVKLSSKLAKIFLDITLQQNFEFSANLLVKLDIIPFTRTVEKNME